MQVVKSKESLRARGGLVSSSVKPISTPASSSTPASTRIDPNQTEYAKWKNACKFECKVCNYSTKAYFTFNFHVKDKHGLVVQVTIQRS